MKTQNIISPFSALFAHFRVNDNFFWKICFCHLLLFLDFYCCAEFKKIIVTKFPEKLVTHICRDGQTDGQTGAETSMNSLEFPLQGFKTELRENSKNICQLMSLFHSQEDLEL